jgi:hypothetical protein
MSDDELKKISPAHLTQLALQARIFSNPVHQCIIKSLQEAGNNGKSIEELEASLRNEGLQRSQPLVSEYLAQLRTIGIVISKWVSHKHKQYIVPERLSSFADIKAFINNEVKPEYMAGCESVAEAPHAEKVMQKDSPPVVYIAKERIKKADAIKMFGHFGNMDDINLRLKMPVGSFPDNNYLDKHKIKLLVLDIKNMDHDGCIDFITRVKNMENPPKILVIGNQEYYVQFKSVTDYYLFETEREQVSTFVDEIRDAQQNIRRPFS